MLTNYFIQTSNPSSQEKDDVRIHHPPSFVLCSLSSVLIYSIPPFFPSETKPTATPPTHGTKRKNTVILSDPDSDSDGDAKPSPPPKKKAAVSTTPSSSKPKAQAKSTPSKSTPKSKALSKSSSKSKKSFDDDYEDEDDDVVDGDDDYMEVEDDEPVPAPKKKTPAKPRASTGSTKKAEASSSKTKPAKEKADTKEKEKEAKTEEPAKPKPKYVSCTLPQLEFTPSTYRNINGILTSFVPPTVAGPPSEPPASRGPLLQAPKPSLNRLHQIVWLGYRSCSRVSSRRFRGMRLSIWRSGLEGTYFFSHLTPALYPISRIAH